MSGDGGLAMLMGELLTAAEQHLPLTAVVFNNGSLGMIRLEQMVAGYPYFGTDHAADFGAIARACGIESWTVTEPEEVREALRAALAHPGPALVDVRTDPNALSLPPRSEEHTSELQSRGHLV